MMMMILTIMMVMMMVMMVVAAVGAERPVLDRVPFGRHLPGAAGQRAAPRQGGLL
jgi:hypothetical protein